MTKFVGLVVQMSTRAQHQVLLKACIHRFIHYFAILVCVYLTKDQNLRLLRTSTASLLA